MRTRYAILDADPAELVGAVDVDALVERVASAYAAETGLDPAILLAALAGEPIRIKVMPGAAIEAVALAVGATTGFGRPCVAGLCLGATACLVLRLDHAGPIVHELVHCLQHRTFRDLDERQAARIADAAG